MAESIDLVDYSEEGEALRQRVRQRRRRVAIPLLGVAAIFAALLAVTWYSYQSNREGALALSEDVLSSLDRRIHSEVENYLNPAADAARILAGMLGDASITDIKQRRRIAEPLAQQILRNLPQLAIISFGAPSGEFLMLRRTAGGAFDTKMIQRPDSGTRTLWIRRNPEGRVTGVEEVANDGYDPRTRPWYQGAVASDGLYWSDVYVFFTDRKPGVTASIPVRASDGDFLAVLGLDITLDELSRFLQGLEIGSSGRAMILDEEGRLVAYPQLDKMLRQEGDKLVNVRLDELGDPVLTRALNRFRVEGHGRRTIDLDGQLYITAVSSLRDVVARDWSVMIVVPENDFVGFVARNNETVLFMSLAVVLLAALVAALLVRQGLRADRNARTVLARQRAIERQGEVFAEVAAAAADSGAELERTRALVTERVAQATGVRRVSLWRIQPGGRLECKDAYDRESQGHTRGMELLATELPHLFSALAREEPLLKTDAASDTETAELHQRYLNPLGCRSLITVPVRVADTTIGFLWLEHDGFDETRARELLGFAQSIANLLSVTVTAIARESAGDEPVIATLHQAERRVSGSSVAVAGSARSEITPPASTRPLVDRVTERARAGGLAAEVFDNTSVMVLEFADALLLAERTAEDEGATVVDLLVRFLEARAHDLRIDYLRVVGSQVIAASGFGGDPQEGAQRIASLATASQERCTRTFGQLRERSCFRVGLDCGQVLGSPVGESTKGYNLWGPAVQTALAMAHAGVQGEVQATEAVYERLREHFLFKPRGAYYVDGVGRMATYLLSGAL